MPAFDPSIVSQPSHRRARPGVRRPGRPIEFAGLAQRLTGGRDRTIHVPAAEALLNGPRGMCRRGPNPPSRHPIPPALAGKLWARSR